MIAVALHIGKIARLGNIGNLESADGKYVKKRKET